MITQSIIQIFYVLGAGQGFFLSLALFTSKIGNRTANNYLASLTLVFSVSLIDYFFHENGVYENHIGLLILFWPKDYLYGVLAYFYVRELIQPKQYPLKGWNYFHFLPVVLQVIVAWSLFFISTDRQIAILYEVPDGLPDVAWEFLMGDFELFTIMASIAIYLLLSLKQLRQHKIRIRDNYSYSEKINLNWLRLLLLSFLGIYSIRLAEIFISPLFLLEQTFDTVMGVSIVLLIYSMGYLGLRQPAMFTQEIKTVSNEVENKKYKKSSLSPDISKIFLKELQHLMLHEKPYLDSKLSLSQLAEKLNISSNYLSQTINEQKNVNFFDFINGYRIKDAKERLEKPLRANENVLTVAIECGFNSKSAFYNAFRKHLDMTPSQYRKSLDSTAQST